MKQHKLQRALVLLISCCFLATSCTTTRVTPFPNEQTPAARPEVEAGNTVKVTLRSGAVKTFKVVRVEADALAGRNLRVPYADMQFLEVKKISAWRSIGLGVGVVVAIAAGLLIYLISTIEDEE